MRMKAKTEGTGHDTRVQATPKARGLPSPYSRSRNLKQKINTGKVHNFTPDLHSTFLAI